MNLGTSVPSSLRLPAMFMCHAIQSKQPVVAASGIQPYYGISTSTTITQALVLGLANRGPNADRTITGMTLNAVGANDYLYYAYPASYGFATFLDTDSQMEGGWDGAYNDMSTLGPITINVSGVPFYVYRSDWPNLGLTHWNVS